MKQFFANAFKWIAGSMDNDPGGASSKKLSAFYALVVLTSALEVTWLIWAYTHDKWEELDWLVTSNLTFAAAALGINAVEKIRGKNNPPPTQ